MERHSKAMRPPLGRSLLGLLRLSLAIAISHTCCGCTLFTNGSHVLLTDPLHFPNNINHITTRHRYRKIANQFLDEFCCANPDLRVSKEYSEGFLDGFTDYVTYGARQAPPALPPRRYWKEKFATPEGFGAIQDWHAGFADGSLEAASSGLREFQTVPSSLLVPSFVPILENEELPAMIPESLETIDAPLHSTSRETLPYDAIVPPVQISPHPESEQAAWQDRPLPEAGGAVQPDGHEADRRSPLAERTFWKQDSPSSAAHVQHVHFETEQLTERGAANVPPNYVDRHSPFAGPPSA